MELMSKLVMPAGRAEVFMGVEIAQTWEGDIFKCTFLSQYGSYLRGDIAGFWSAEKIDHVVEIARAGTFFQSTDFLGENFGVGIALNVDSVLWKITVVMAHRGHDRLFDENFIGGKVKFDFGH